MWKMKAPEKKPLVRKEDAKDLRSQIKKSAIKKNVEPVKALSEFQEIDTSSFCWENCFICLFTDIVKRLHKCKCSILTWQNICGCPSWKASKTGVC